MKAVVQGLIADSPLKWSAIHVFRGFEIEFLGVVETYAAGTLSHHAALCPCRSSRYCLSR